MPTLAIDLLEFLWVRNSRHVHVLLQRDQLHLKYEYTKHAQFVMAQRAIPVAWVERALESPELIVPDPEDAAVERRFCRIPEFGGRILRVAVNCTVEPTRVVSVFFDRGMKGKL